MVMKNVLKKVVTHDFFVRLLFNFGFETFMYRMGVELILKNGLQMSEIKSKRNTRI